MGFLTLARPGKRTPTRDDDWRSSTTTMVTSGNGHSWMWIKRFDQGTGSHREQTLNARLVPESIIQTLIESKYGFWCCECWLWAFELVLPSGYKETLRWLTAAAAAYCFWTQLTDLGHLRNLVDLSLLPYTGHELTSSDPPSVVGLLGWTNWAFLSDASNEPIKWYMCSSCMMEKDCIVLVWEWNIDQLIWFRCFKIYKI